MLFSTAATEYMADKGKRLRATTLEGYRSAIRCHLMPQWGGREIETISFEEVQDWVDSFDLPGAAEKAYKTFRQIYRWVLRRHQLRIWDVTQGVELPKKPTVRRAHRGCGLAIGMGSRPTWPARSWRRGHRDWLQDQAV